jgi:hypothetical protein
MAQEVIEEYINIVGGPIFYREKKPIFCGRKTTKNKTKQN